MLSSLDFFPPLPPPPPPPPPPPQPQLPPPLETLNLQESDHHSSSYSYNPSLIIIAAILAFVFIASASIHLLLRFLSRSSSSSSSSPALIHHHSSTTSSAPSSPSDRDQTALIDSLPLFSLASSLPSLPKSSPDCAVCLSTFRPHDQLRLLPSCRHAFHQSCIDTWLRSTPSCPLCRRSIHLPPPAPPPPATDGSGSFRLEIGSVSRRRTPEDDVIANLPPPPHVRSYSLGSSFEYLVEEEVEAVVASIRRRSEKEEKDEFDGVASPHPPPPGPEIAEAAGGGGRGWLKEYVDRLASSASSSFSSLRFSGRWSHRFDGGAAAGGGGGGGSWDLEGNGNEYRNGEEGGYSTSFYRWLIGA